MTDSRIENLLQDIRLSNEHNYQVICAARDLIMKTVKGMSQEVKYGGILFTLETPFCGLFAYQAHVSLEFSNGASLQDDAHVLEGKGKFRRHIKLRDIQDLASKKVVHYVELAAKADS